MLIQVQYSIQIMIKVIFMKYAIKLDYFQDGFYLRQFKRNPNFRQRKFGNFRPIWINSLF
jgi:hypothetical protein